MAVVSMRIEGTGVLPGRRVWGQDAKLQLDALVAAGVQKRDVFAESPPEARPPLRGPG